MRETITLGAKLLVIAALAGALLGATYEFTKGPIEQHEKDAFNQACAEVCPTGKEYRELPMEMFSEPLNSAVAALGANGEKVGYVFGASGRGYGGDVPVTVGVSADGRVTGLRVGANGETQGYGSLASEPAFYEQFAGIPADTFAYGDQVQAISGATRTSNAIRDAVNKAIDAFKQIPADYTP